MTEIENGSAKIIAEAVEHQAIPFLAETFPGVKVKSIDVDVYDVVEAEDGDHFIYSSYVHAEIEDSMVANLDIAAVTDDDGLDTEFVIEENTVWLILKNGMGFKLKSLPETAELQA
jgi:hypothetical protein